MDSSITNTNSSRPASQSLMLLISFSCATFRKRANKVSAYILRVRERRERERGECRYELCSNYSFNENRSIRWSIMTIAEPDTFHGTTLTRANRLQTWVLRQSSLCVCEMTYKRVHDVSVYVTFEAFRSYSSLEGVRVRRWTVSDKARVREVFTIKDFWLYAILFAFTRNENEQERLEKVRERERQYARYTTANGARRGQHSYRIGVLINGGRQRYSVRNDKIEGQ